MTDTNLNQVREKLFSTKPSSEKMNDEIRSSILRMKEAQLRRLRPSEFDKVNRRDSSLVNLSPKAQPECEGEAEPISDEDYAKISELSDFIAEHIKEVGKEQTILDFQVGLNLLNNYRKDSLIETKIKLEEDSDFGEKTYGALVDVLFNYPVEVVKRYIKLGAANNAIWATKNNTKIDTDKKVENVTKKLDERRN